MPLGTWPPVEPPVKKSRLRNLMDSVKISLKERIFNFFSGENLEVMLLIAGMVFAYNVRLLFTDQPDQMVAFLTGITLFGTPTLLLYFYYKKLRNIFARTIVLALILLTLKEFIGGILYLVDVRIELFNNFAYGASFISQVAFLGAVLVISFLRASRIDGMVYTYFCHITGSWGSIHPSNDTEGNKNPDKSDDQNKRTS